MASAIGLAPSAIDFDFGEITPKRKKLRTQ
jgi:hypothetical protein